MENRDAFGQARRDAVLNAIHESISETGKSPSTDVLDRVARKAEGKVIERIGNQSEKRFVEFASKSLIVKSVVNANPLNDVYDAIDKWTLFIDGFNLPPIPVQIKSSPRGVDVFKYGDPSQNKRPNASFQKLHGLMMVLNCGPSVKNPDLFDKQLRREIGRIVQIMDNDHPAAKHLTDITPNRFKDSSSFKIR